MSTFWYHPMAFTIYGFFLGLLFPLLGITVIAAKYSCGLWTAHFQYGGDLIYIIDSAPLFLGILFFFVGRKHTQVISTNKKLHKVVRNRTNETVSTRLLYEKQKMITQLSVTCHHQINNPLTIAVGIAEQLQDNRSINQDLLKGLMRALHEISNTVSAIEKIKEDVQVAPYAEGVDMLKLPKKRA